MRIMQTNGGPVWAIQMPLLIISLCKTRWPIDEPEELESLSLQGIHCFWPTLNYPWLQALWWLRVGWGIGIQGLTSCHIFPLPNQPLQTASGQALSVLKCVNAWEARCFVFLLLPTSLLDLFDVRWTWRIPYVIWMLLHFTKNKWCNEVTVICGPGSCVLERSLLGTWVHCPPSLTLLWLLPSISGSAWCHGALRNLFALLLCWCHLLLAVLPSSLCSDSLSRHPSPLALDGLLSIPRNEMRRSSSLAPWLPYKRSGHLLEP